jgi:hypothetical protein
MVLSILHHPFKKKDIIGVIEQTARLKQLKEHLQKNQALFDYLLDRVLDETSGFHYWSNFMSMMQLMNSANVIMKKILVNVLENL